MMDGRGRVLGYLGLGGLGACAIEKRARLPNAFGRVCQVQHVLQHRTINSGLLSRQRFTTDLEFGRIISERLWSGRWESNPRPKQNPVRHSFGIALLEQFILTLMQAVKESLAVDRLHSTALNVIVAAIKHFADFCHLCQISSRASSTRSSVARPLLEASSVRRDSVSGLMSTHKRYCTIAFIPMAASAQRSESSLAKNASDGASPHAD